MEPGQRLRVTAAALGDDLRDFLSRPDHREPHGFGVVRRAAVGNAGLEAVHPGARAGCCRRSGWRSSTRRCRAARPGRRRPAAGARGHGPRGRPRSSTGPATSWSTAGPSLGRPLASKGRTRSGQAPGAKTVRVATCAPAWVIAIRRPPADFVYSTRARIVPCLASSDAAELGDQAVAPVEEAGDGGPEKGRVGGEGGGDLVGIEVDREAAADVDGGDLPAAGRRIDASRPARTWSGRRLP